MNRMLFCASATYLLGVVVLQTTGIPKVGADAEGRPGKVVGTRILEASEKFLVHVCRLQSGQKPL